MSQHDEEYHDHFDEYDYHEEGVEEASSFLPFLALGLLLSNRSKNNNDNLIGTFLFFMFLPITLPFLIMKEGIVVAFKIISFIVINLFRFIKFVFKSNTVKEHQSPKQNKHKTKTFQQSTKSKNKTFNKQSANNYIAKTTQATVPRVNIKTDDANEIEEINQKIKKLEQQKKKLNEKPIQRIKAKDLNNAGRGNYYDNNASNAELNASKLAEQATIKYI